MFHPISKIPFVTKVKGKTVLPKQIPFLNTEIWWNLSNLGTETALLKVTNNLLLTPEAGNNAVLILLNLIATFSIVAHIEQRVGIRGTA